MPGKNQKGSCTSPTSKGMTNWKVESIISIDERGQMVLPKELRDKAKIRSGDKLALLSWEKEGEICCLYLKDRTACRTGKRFSRSDDEGDGGPLDLKERNVYGRDKIFKGFGHPKYFMLATER